MVTRLFVPAASATGQSGFYKLGARRYLVISIAMAAVRLEVEDGRIKDAAVSVGACAPVASRQTGLESRLVGRPRDDIDALATEAMPMIADSLSPIDDVRASAGYRRQAAAELAWRSIRSLCREAA